VKLVHLVGFITKKFVGVVLYCDTFVGTAIHLTYLVFNPKIIAE
jgi:hypothetical protein